MIENIVENCYNVHIAVSTANIDAKELGIMRFTIRGKNIEVTEGLRSAVTEKLGKLEKYFTPETEIIVTLSVEKDRQKIEVTIPVKGNIIRSEQVSNDMYVSIDLVEEVIERQLRKYKTKIIGKHKDGGNLRKEFIEKENEGEEEELIDKKQAAQSFSQLFIEEAEEAEAEEAINIVKTKRFGMKPMFPEDACVQMELLGHSFFVFRNADTDEVNVVYKRKGNTYGLIEPEC